MRAWGLIGVALLSAALSAGPSPAQIRMKPPAAHPVGPANADIISAGSTTLKICAQATCREGLGAWLTILSVAPGSRNTAYDLRWTTTARLITTARWQVSTRPLAGTDDRNGLVSEGDAGSPQTGRFQINFSALPPLGQQGGLHMAPAGQNRLRVSAMSTPKLFPPRYFVRIIPLVGSKPVPAASNTVEVDFPSTAPQQDNPIVQLDTDVYTTSIVRFELVTPQTLPWGCLIVTGVDKSAFTGVMAAQYPLYLSRYQSGAPLCPATYKGIGEKAWYESFWDFASSGVSWVSKAYAGIKATAIKGIVASLNALPGKLCNATCEKGLTLGLNAGLAALGVPPNLPNMEALTDQGLNYLVAAAAEQAGIDCDAACQNAIRSGIKQMTKDATNATVASYCSDVEEAHRNGAEPLCLPPGVTAKPAPASATQPAYVVVRVTRKPDAKVHPFELGPDRIKIAIDATNPTAVGVPFVVPVSTCERDGYLFPCEPVTLKFAKPLTGPLFLGVQANLLKLKPGESAEFTFYLKPAVYWLPGHKELLDRNGSRLRYNDWGHYYPGARVTVTADVECPQTVGSAMASCVRHPAANTYTMPGRAR